MPRRSKILNAAACLFPAAGVVAVADALTPGGSVCRACLLFVPLAVQPALAVAEIPGTLLGQIIIGIIGTIGIYLGIKERRERIREREIEVEQRDRDRQFQAQQREQQRQWDHEDRVRIAAELKAEQERVARESRHKQAGQLQAIVTRIDEQGHKLDENTQVTKETREDAKAAYSIANNVNEKFTNVDEKVAALNERLIKVLTPFDELSRSGQQTLARIDETTDETNRTVKDIAEAVDAETPQDGKAGGGRDGGG